MFGCEKKRSKFSCIVLISKVPNLVSLQRQIYLDKISLLQLCSFNNILSISYFKKKKKVFSCVFSPQFSQNRTLGTFVHTHTLHINSENYTNNH